MYTVIRKHFLFLFVIDNFCVICMYVHIHRHTHTCAYLCTWRSKRLMLGIFLYTSLSFWDSFSLNLELLFRIVIEAPNPWDATFSTLEFQADAASPSFLCGGWTNSGLHACKQAHCPTSQPGLQHKVFRFNRSCSISGCVLCQCLVQSGIQRARGSKTKVTLFRILGTC